MSIAAAAAYVVLLGSLAWKTAPQLIDLGREALHLCAMSYKQRRSAVIGPLYDQARAISAAIPKDKPLAIIVKHARDVDRAVLFNYYIYPRTTKIYPTLAAYRNAPDHPWEIVYFDWERGPEPRRMLYAKIRAEQMGDEFISASLEPAAPPRSEFVIPVVASLDGPVETYTTEAVIENAGDAQAIVSLAFFPLRHVRKLVIAPRGRVSWNDFVYQNFGLLDYGWVRVTSNQSLRARFRFVNRTAESAEDVPPIANEKATSLHLTAPPGARLWLVNPGEGDVAVRVNGAARLAPPMGVRQFPAEPEMQLDSDRPFFAFASWRDADGRSRFAWPEER